MAVTLAELIAERNRIVETRAALLDELKAVDAQVAHVLGDRGFARYGDTIYRTGPASTKTVCDDPVGFSEYLEQAPAVVLRQAFNPSYVRKTGLPEGVFDTFFHTERDDARILQAVPVGKAPKFMQASAEGTVILDGEEMSVDEVTL